MKDKKIIVERILSHLEGAIMKFIKDEDKHLVSAELGDAMEKLHKLVSK